MIEVPATGVRLSGSLREFLAVEPVDLRNSFNGLHGVVLDRLKEAFRNA
jgi:hypothetical protein